MENIENMANNACPKLDGHDMAYDGHDAKEAYQYHRKKNKCQ
jgi:hypothetical protein